jgi:hypothetical protein
MVGLPIAADGGPQRDPTLQDLDGHRIRLSLAPELMIAYGLALQGLGRQRVRLSLAPERIRWVARRRRQFPLLALGCALAFVLAGAFLFRTYLQLTDERKSLEARGEEIGKCENVIPRLEELQRGIRHLEKMLVPIVAKASRARRFQETVNRLAEARGADDWFIYLADQESYQAGRSKEEVAKSRAVGPGSPAAAGAGMMLMPRPGGTSPDPDVPDAFPLRVQAEQVAPLDVLIAALYTRWQQKDPYAPVKEIVSKLNATTAANSFKEVDILPPSERTGREDIFLPWQNYFKNLPPEPSYRPFLLRIPFAELEINPQVAAQETREGGR